MYAMIETLPRWSNSPQDFRACGVRVHSQGTAGLEPLSHRMHLDSYLITIGPSQEHHPLHINHRILHHERAIRVILLKQNFTIR